MDKVELRIDPFPSEDELAVLRASAWGREAGDASYAGVLKRSLCHVGAYSGTRLVGFVNIAWDGGVHAFLLDTCVHSDFRRLGIAVRLVAEARETARARGAEWLHVDFEPQLQSLYYDACGFRPTLAGLIQLRRSGTDT
jgi:ribosomal protein S18 acetylase RimI-like enzyme